MMKTRNIENRLALVGAFIVLLGVLSAATSAFAAEPTDAKTNGVAAKRNDVSVEAVRGARKANAEAAAEAAEALKAETTLELEIQLGDLTSGFIASTR